MIVGDSATFSLLRVYYPEKPDGLLSHPVFCDVKQTLYNLIDFITNQSPFISGARITQITVCV